MYPILFKKFKKHTTCLPNYLIIIIIINITKSDQSFQSFELC